MVREEISNIIKKISGNDCQLTFPERDEHGDLTTNLAMIQTGKKPREYAEDSWRRK